MKNKLLILLIVVMMSLCSVIGFAACDKINTGKEQTPQTADLPSDDKDKTSDDDTEISDTIVLTAETDFDALESDKVSEEEFNKYFYELFRLMPGGGGGHFAFGFRENATLEMSFYNDKDHNFEYVGSAFFKRDSFNMQETIYHNGTTMTRYYLFSDNLKNGYIFEGISGNIIDEIWIEYHQPDEKYPKELMQSLTCSYDENENQYVLYKNNQWFADCKIKNERIVYFKVYEPNDYSDYNTVVCKLYDIGTTTIDLPVSIELPFAN